MFKLLIIFFLISFVIWPIAKVLYYLFNARKFARQQQEAFRKAYSRSAEDSASNYYEGGNRQNHSRKKKIFSKTDGEYVDFEEISSETTIGEKTSATSDKYIREDQVSDAEWTEIK